MLADSYLAVAGGVSLSRERFSRLVLSVVAISAGVLVLLSLVFKSDMLTLLRGILVEWTLIVVAFALLIGVLNVLRVHIRRIKEGRGTAYSLILIVGFLIVFIPGMLSPTQVPGWSALVGPDGAIVDFMYRYVQRPLQATLFSLMAFFVATAAWRAFRIRSAASLIMFIAAIVILVGSIKLELGEGWSLLSDTAAWMQKVPAMAGARGILLGISLGTFMAGLRLLLGIDRPYSD